jgi:hypothetical protein
MTCITEREVVKDHVRPPPEFCDVSFLNLTSIKLNWCVPIAECNHRYSCWKWQSTRLLLHWLPLGSPIQTITQFPCDHGVRPCVYGTCALQTMCCYVYIWDSLQTEHGIFRRELHASDTPGAPLFTFTSHGCPAPLKKGRVWGFYDTSSIREPPKVS